MAEAGSEPQPLSVIFQCTCTGLRHWPVMRDKMSPHRCVMSWLVLGPHVILATESSFWELHLMVLDVLCAGRGEEGELLPISPSSFVAMMILRGLVGQGDLMLWPSCSPPVYNFIQICPWMKALPSPLFASRSSLAAAVLHSGFAIQKPPEQKECYPGERERDLCLADRCCFCMNIFFLLTV